MARFLWAVLVAMVLAVAPASAQTQSVLPSGMTQFTDGNGAPYAGGHVYMYVPKTTTPKTTYQDPNGATPNANPITLDANGRAVIWGSGMYRQVLQDMYGNVVWDQPTLGLSTGGGSVGTAGINQYLITAAPYGAKCDGVSNDTGPIQAAINAAEAAGGGEVLVPTSAQGCLVTGTLSITHSGVVLRGSVLSGMPQTSGTAVGAWLNFQNGAADDIDIGFAGHQIDGNAVRDLYIQNTGKTGGTAISVNWTSWTTIENVWVNNAFNGVWFNHINNGAIKRTNLNCTVNGNAWCLQYNTTGGPTMRSDVLTIADVNLQLLNATGVGFLIDGFSNDVHADHFSILGAGSYGLLISNTSHSNCCFPAYGFFNDLEIDGENDTAVEINAGVYWYFNNSEMDSIRSVNSTVPIMRVLPDTGFSYTRGIFMSNTFIASGPGTCLVIDAMDSVITGSTMVDCGHYAGANGLGGPTAPVPAVLVGTTMNGLNMTGNVIGYTFGQCCAGSNNYAVQVDIGATRVMLGSNNYTLFAATTTETIINGAGAGLTLTAGGIDYAGNSMSPYMQYGGQYGVNDFRILNNGTGAFSCARSTLGTGTGGSYAIYSLCDGATPISVISTGPAVTGGMVVSVASGALTLDPVDSLVFNPHNGVVQFLDAGSYSANGANPLTLLTGPGNTNADPTKWLKIYDPGGGVYVVPLWLCTSGC